MGKFFAILLIIITLVSVYPIVTHTWWMPEVGVRSRSRGRPPTRRDNDRLGGSVYKLSVRFAGIHLGLRKYKGKIKNWPGGHRPGRGVWHNLGRHRDSQPSFVGSKVWAAMYIAKPDPRASARGRAGGAVCFLFPLCRTDGEFGGIHPDKINDGNGNYFGLDPENDVAARDDIVVGTLTIPVNTPIFLTLHSKDMIHNFYVPELRIQQDIVPGIDIPLHFHGNENGEVGNRLHPALRAWVTTA